jgi:hypothetical protein
VDPRAGLDDVEKRKFLTLPGLELRPLRGPARSQSLYRLRYPGSCFKHTSDINTPVENSSILTQEFSSVKLPTEGMMYPGS